MRMKVGNHAFADAIGKVVHGCLRRASRHRSGLVAEMVQRRVTGVNRDGVQPRLEMAIAM